MICDSVSLLNGRKNLTYFLNKFRLRVKKKEENVYKKCHPVLIIHNRKTVNLMLISTIFFLRIRLLNFGREKFVWRWWSVFKCVELLIPIY